MKKTPILDRQIVLKLNRLWQPIGWTSPRKSIVAMCGGAYGGTPPSLGMSITVEEDGTIIEATPTKWEDWIKLPVRDGDLSLGTKNGPVRCPTVLIEPNFEKMPTKIPKLSAQAILERDGYIDQYTGEKLTRDQASIDHVVPRDRGGRDTWENLVCCEKKRNHTKSNSLNEEIGLRLIRKPKAPKPIPVSATLGEARHKTHIKFVT